MFFFHSKVDSEIEIKAYYAGHVLGAAMFHVKVGNQSVVYTVSFDDNEDVEYAFYLIPFLWFREITT